jgi:chromosome segregation ATPase
MKLNPFTKKPTTGYYTRIKTEHAEAQRALEALQTELAAAQADFEAKRQACIDMERRNCDKPYLSETEVAMRRVRDEAFHQAEDLRRRINDQEAECAKLRQIVEAPALLEKARGDITRLRRCRGALQAEREQSSKLLAKLDERIVDLEQRVAEEMQSASDAMAVAEGEFAVSGTLTKLDTELRVTRAACDKVNAKLQNLDEQLRAIPTQLAEAERAFRCAQAAEADIDFNEQVPHLMDVIARASVSAHSINSYGRREDEFTITIPRDYVEAARAKLAAEVPGYAGGV